MFTVCVTPEPSRPTAASVDDAFVSGDAVALDLRVARLGSRGLARLIDLMVQLALIAALVLIGTAIAAVAGLDEALLATVQVITAVTAFIGYPVLMQTLTRGRTFGKLALGLRVVRDDGGHVRFRHALTRELVGVASEWPGLLPPLTWFASLWCMLASPRSKRLGDVAAGTIVIHDRTPVLWGWIPTMPPHLRGWAASLDMTGVSDDLALAIRQYLVRYRFLHGPSRVRLGAALTAEVVARITPMPPGGISGGDFLAAVLAERHLRSVRRLTRARASTAVVWPELAMLTGPAYPYMPIPPVGWPPAPGQPIMLRPPAPAA